MKKASKPLKKRVHTPKATDTATVEEAIRPYAIADKLRTLRLRRSMGLAQLAEHSGFSPAMLSRLSCRRVFVKKNARFFLPTDCACELAC